MYKKIFVTLIFIFMNAAYACENNNADQQAHYFAKIFTCRSHQFKNWAYRALALSRKNQIKKLETNLEEEKSEHLHTQEKWIAHICFRNLLDYFAWHGTDISSSMPTNFCFITYTAQ